MKNIFTLLAAVLITASIFAQAPQKMSYQAVVRDASDVLITNQTVGVQISILQGSDIGTAVYVETQTPMTNDNGLMSLEAGAGILVSGVFSTIDWGSDIYFIKTEIDPTGGSTYTISGVSQLLSVPYALYAASSGDSHNSLDQAYNQGQTTFPASRIIDVDDGQIKMIADGNVALEIESDFADPGLLVIGYGDGGAIDIGNIANSEAGDAFDIANDGGGDAIDIDNAGTGDALDISNIGAGNAIIIENSGDGNGLELNNTGDGFAVIIDNSTSIQDVVSITNNGNGDALSVVENGLGKAGYFSSTNPTNAANTVEIDNDGIGNALNIDNSNSTMGDGISVNNDGGGDALGIANLGGGDGISVTNEGAGNGVYINNDGTGNGLQIDNLVTNTGNAIQLNNSGLGMGLNVQNSNSANANISLNVKNSGTANATKIWQSNALAAGDAVLIDNDGTGHAINIDNSAGLGGDGILVTQFGAGSALHVEEIGVGHGLLVEILNPVSPLDASVVLNGGEGAGLFVANLNPLSPAPTAFFDNSGLGSSIEALISDPTNDKPVIEATNLGLGGALNATVADMDFNGTPTIFSTNMGSGSAGHFETFDNPVAKANIEPTVNVISNGMGTGVNISILNPLFGSDSNLEPALNATHEGYGQVGHFETSHSDNSAHSVEILNSGYGSGLHIETMDNVLHDSEPVLHVEQSNTSLVLLKGQAAVFELHSPISGTDACVKINSSAVGLGHSALRVIPATVFDMAATFEGKVEIAGDTEIIGELSSPVATIGTLFVPTTLIVGDIMATSTITTSLLCSDATISDLTVTTSISAPAKAFKIDHPLDPNKFLYHNSIESNERINIYSGNIITDAEGIATVRLPDYMNALNSDFRYQLTIMDKSFAQAIIWEEMNLTDNSFVIKTNEPNIKVSWQVTGKRIDKWALDNPFEVEVDKDDVN